LSRIGHSETALRLPLKNQPLISEVKAMKYIAALIFLFPLSLQANSYCKRAAVVDSEFPAGLRGTYDMIGRDPVTQKPYTGLVEIEYSSSSYKLTRIIDNDKITGDAWIEYCGPDKTLHFFMKYHTSPNSLELFCSLNADGGNYYRITCRSKYDGSSWEEKGLEALFQRK